MNNRKKVLIIGYGNPGRLDDGLGPAFASAIEKMDLPGVTVDSNYQLTVEDAYTVSQHDIVIFADAEVGGHEPFSFRRIMPKTVTSFTSHSVEPEAVLAMAKELFGADTKGYILGIRGYDFDEFGEGLSEGATANLAETLKFIKNVLIKKSFDRIEARIDEPTIAHAAHMVNGDE